MFPPPTPTPQPTGIPLFSLPTNNFSLWGSTDMVIQFWNWMGPAGTVLQVILLVVCVFVGFKILSHWVDQFTGKDAQS